MRLLNIRSFEFQEFNGNEIPPYITTSHRWLGDETTYQDASNKRNTDCAGYRKIEGFCKIAAQNGSIDYLWIDTACIDKTSSAELTESINSMFRWYSRSQYCYSYLADVRPLSAGYEAVMADFASSSWFHRGWCLQELLAPSCVIFLTRDWEVMGHKCSTGLDVRDCVGCAQPLNTHLNNKIAEITGLPQGILWDYEASKDIRPRDRWCWMSSRETTKPEDKAYAMLGVFDVYMPLIYGEGEQNATQRLRQEIMKKNRQANQGPPPASKPQNPASKPQTPSGSIMGDDPFFRKPLFTSPQVIGKTAAAFFEERRRARSRSRSTNPQQQRAEPFQMPSRIPPVMPGNSDTSLTPDSSRSRTPVNNFNLPLPPASRSQSQGPSSNGFYIRYDPMDPLLNPAQVAAAREHLSNPNIDRRALAQLNVAQIKACGDQLPFLDLSELVGMNVVQIKRALKSRYP